MKGIRIADGSTIWENGSRTYGAKGQTADPPGTWPYPPLGGGTPVEIVVETPAQHPGVAVGEPYGPEVSPAPPGPVVQPAQKAPVIQPRHEIEPLPAGLPKVSPAGWDRWQQLVKGWGCLIAWGGGDLDRLTVALGGNMPLYVTNSGSKTAIGWWRDVLDRGYDKATSPEDLTKGIAVETEAIREFVRQFNEIGALARTKGYKGCPPAAPPPGAPSAAEDALSTISNARAGLGRMWGNLSPRGKLLTGAVGLGALFLIARGASK